MMDQGLFPGNYFDYVDDEIAVQREVEIGESLLQGQFIDELFPPNARSLYFDPLNPPKGSLPNECIKWFRISENDILGCEKPILFQDDLSSCQIVHGALGDKYFLNALTLLSLDIKYLKRLFVSTKYADKGLYTLKFYKAGKWRYVHIDDYIPCRQSGKVHFCRNMNPNETYAMLIEKAYAKLHGCYEALTYGMIEKAVLDLTPASGAECLRMERFNRKTICDEIWERLDKSLSKGCIVGCGRFTKDPFAENPALRQGITLSEIYQVIDLQIVSADPTEDFDALTVGMICVRNLQNDTGRFNGRWSFGNYLWSDYKQIAQELADRTKQIQKDRGISDQTKTSINYAKPISNRINYDDNILNGDEPDTLDVRYIEKNLGNKVVQPIAEDLFWIQIEDFVEVFNRVYLVTDISFDKRAACKRFVSKWLPGDYLAGAAGPPVIISKEPVEEDDEEEKEVDDEGDEENKKSNSDAPKPIKYEKTPLINELFTDNPMYPFAVTEPTTMILTLYQYDKRWNSIGRYGQDPTKVLTSQFYSRKQKYESVMKYSLGIGFLLTRLSGLKIRTTEFRLKKISYTSQYISFSSSISVVLQLFPGRYAIIPFTHTNLDRATDYAIHCQYLNNHIEFEVEDVIKQRLQDKEPSDDGYEEGRDEELSEEPDDNDLLVIQNDPIQDANLEENMEEVNAMISADKSLNSNPLVQKTSNTNTNTNSSKASKASDTKKSVDSKQKEEEPGPDELKQIITDNVAILSYEKVKREEASLSGGDDHTLGSASLAEQGRPAVPLPRLFFYQPWEYQEEMEELSMKHLYTETSEMMKYIRTLKTEVRKLYTQMKQTSNTQATGNIANNNTSPRQNVSPRLNDRK